MLEDCALESTLDFKFPSRNTSMVMTTLAGSPVVAAYVDNNTTEITAGITLTTDFDGKTGLNHVRALLTAANGYTDNTKVIFTLTAGTVGGQSVVGEPVKEITIGRGASAVFDIVAAGDIGNRMIMETILGGVTTNILNDKAGMTLLAANIQSFWEVLTANGGTIANSFGKVINDFIAASPSANAIRDAIFNRTFSTKMGSLTYDQLSALTLLAVSGKLTISGGTHTIRNVNDTANAITVTTDATGRTAVTYTLGSLN
jgi:hypothetical protein